MHQVRQQLFLPFIPVKHGALAVRIPSSYHSQLIGKAASPGNDLRMLRCGYHFQYRCHDLCGSRRKD